MISPQCYWTDTGYTVLWQEDDDFYEKINDTSITVSVGLCGVLPKASYDDTYIPQDRDAYFRGGTPMKPSIGNKGEFCVCVKPNESYDADTTYPVLLSDFDDLRRAHKGTSFSSRSWNML